MEVKGSEEGAHSLVGVDHERQVPNGSNKGGWITFPFLAVAMVGVGVASGGATSNLVVYLIREYHVSGIDAAQISNIISGCLSVAPVAGAVLADSFFGCYPVVAVCTAVCVLALSVFTLTASIPALRPPSCSPGSIPCQPATAGPMAALYTAVCLLSVSTAGARFNQATMGANQFDAVVDRDVFFNWYFVFLYASAIFGSTVIVYIQDTVSWTVGFALSGAASVVGLAALLLGAQYYRRPPAQGSPFTDLARVVVVAATKRKAGLTALEELRYYHGSGERDGKVGDFIAPSESFRFLNRAALITDGDIITTTAGGSEARPWRLCTVQQVEDFKTVLRILPLWRSSIFLSIAIGIQISFTVVQALAMDRLLGRFTVPASSIMVSCFVAVVVSLGLLDRVLLPLWQRLTNHSLRPLQRIGAGHVLTTVSMVASAIIEHRRTATVRAHRAEGRPEWVSPMSAMWLVLPFVLAGVGEALHFPAQVTLYYQEFPQALKNTATSMIAMIVALGFYLSTAVVDVVRRVTSWLPDNMNASRLENLYWLLAVLLSINFCYYMLCAKLYKVSEHWQVAEHLTLVLC